jgi:hypothetical protein
MQKSALLAAIQQEIHRHDFSHFVNEPPSVAEGGKGVCRGRLSGMQKAPQLNGAIPRPSGNRRDARTISSAFSARRARREPCTVGQLAFLTKWYDGNVLARRFFGQDFHCSCGWPLRKPSVRGNKG